MRIRAYSLHSSGCRLTATSPTISSHSRCCIFALAAPSYFSQLDRRCVTIGGATSGYVFTDLPAPTNSATPSSS